MSKNRELWGQKMYLRLIREGRGQGERADYSPWLTTHNVPSNGLISRILGRKTGRLHSYLSRNELEYHYILEYNPLVTDIREQFPMRLCDTLRIAEKLGIRHPVVNGFPYVMTTDFLITASSRLYARTVKMVKDLSNPRVLEKFRIEAEYWREHEIDWKIVTEREINKDKAANIEWLYSGESLSVVIPDEAVCEQFKGMFFDLYQDPQVSFRECIDKTESFFGVPSGTALCALKEFILNGTIHVDMEHRLDLRDPRKGVVRQYDKS